MMQQSYSEPRRRRWPLVLVFLFLLAAGLWAGGWYYAAGKVEETIAGWKAREARAGRVYSCSSQTVSGFPFQIQVRCADAGADLKTNQPPVALKAKDIWVTAQVWQPTVLTSEIVGPLMIGEPAQPPSLVAHWRHAQTQVHGLPIAPESATITLEDATVDRASGIETQRLFQAKRTVLQGRLVQGSVTHNPVIEVVLKLVAGAAPSLHPVAAIPLDADVTAVLHGLKDFSPKPWPARFRELQAAGGRIDVTHARLQQGETLVVAVGALGLSLRGRLDGQLRLTVANLEKLLPALGLDKMAPQQAAPNRMTSALDRLAPGLGNIARQNAGPALVAGLAFLGQPAEIEGRRAVMLPLRFSDGAVSLGPIPLGQVPPLF